MAQAIHKALILGMGSTGLSCARFCLAQGINCVVADDNPQPKRLSEFQSAFPQLAYHTGQLSSSLLEGVDTVLVSPGIALSHPLLQQALKQGCKLSNDIELFAHYVNAPVIAITGSNGKSTVTTLVHHLLQAAGKTAPAGGNLGTPALDLLQTPAPDFYVLELSSFQLELVENLQLRVAAMLNLSADHLDRYASLADYAAAKARIFRHAEHCVRNLDDAVVRQMPIPAAANILEFTATAPATDAIFGIETVESTDWLCQGQQRLLPAQQLNITGKHNQLNALAALAIIAAAGIEPASVLQALSTFSGLPHRCQLVAEYNGVRWINDSKATNIGATIAALTGMTAPIILLAGGVGKGADFTELRPAMTQVRLLIVFGEAAAALIAALANYVVCQQVADMPAAILLAKQTAQSGDVVLLAPACASWDQYDNYQQRGLHFEQLVKEVLV